MATKTGKLYFNVTGEFLTSYSKELVLEGNWEEAIRFLMESLEGLTYDYSVQVLSGTHQIIGESRKDSIELEEQVDAKYMKRLDDMYAHYVRVNRKWYVPYAYVSNYGAADFARYEEEENLITGTQLKQCRARHYCESETDLIFFLEYDHSNYPILFKTIESPPIWTQFSRKTPQQAINAARAYCIDETGYTQKYGEKGEFDDSILKSTFKDRDNKKKNPEFKVESIVILAPIIDGKKSSECGWVDPNGDFYGCAYGGHINLAERVVTHVLKLSGHVDNNQQMNNNSEAALENSGWLKIGRSGNNVYFLKGKKPVTQPQLDTTFDWCKKHAEKFPEYLGDDSCQ